MSGITPGLPSLLKAEKIQKRVKRVGFEWDDCMGPLQKIQEELGELKPRE